MNRNGLGRFENGGAIIAGAYQPTGFVPEIQPTLLNVAYFALPTETTDGYIARLAFDVNPVVFQYWPPPWADLRVSQHPIGVLAMLGRIERIHSQDTPGAAFATYADPTVRGGDWYFYFGGVPEPGTLGLLLAGIFFIRLRSR